RLANAVEQEKAHPLFNPDPAGTHAPIAKDFRDPPVGTLVFLPGANVVAEFDQLTRAFLLELGTDPGDFSALRDDHGQHTFARAPAHAGVVGHARAGFDVDGVDLLLAHQLLGPGNTGFALVVADRNYARGHLRQTSDQLGNILLLLD